MSDVLRVTLCVDAIEREVNGIGRYAWELARRLPGQPGVSTLRYFARKRLIDDPGRLMRGEELRHRRGFLRAAAAWQTKTALRSTVVHGPNYFLPVGAETGVITVHDLSVFHYPHTHPAARVEEFERCFISSLERASHAITDSETIRTELIDMFAVPPERVAVVSLGVGTEFRRRDQRELQIGLEKFALNPGAYGLCVSALEPRKKIPQLLAAWRRLPKHIRDVHPLVLAGGSGWMNEQLHEQIAAGRREGWLVHLGHLTDTDLHVLYSGAALFIYPSIYEGFGLPPIEAMASGVPTIVSNSSCLPEVCGDAARYVNPDDDNDFLTAIEEGLLSDQWRSLAIRRGLDRAALFTWQRCIQDTVAVYRRVNCR